MAKEECWCQVLTRSNKPLYYSDSTSLICSFFTFLCRTLVVNFSHLCFFYLMFCSPLFFSSISESTQIWKNSWESLQMFEPINGCTEVRQGLAWSASRCWCLFDDGPKVSQKYLLNISHATRRSDSKQGDSVLMCQVMSNSECCCWDWNSSDQTYIFQSIIVWLVDVNFNFDLSFLFDRIVTWCGLLLSPMVRYVVH